MFFNIHLRYLASVLVVIVKSWLTSWYIFNKKKLFYVQFKQLLSCVEGHHYGISFFDPYFFLQEGGGRNLRICYWIFNNIQNINTWVVCASLGHYNCRFMVTSLKRPYVTFWRPLNLSISSTQTSILLAYTTPKWFLCLYQKNIILASSETNSNGMFSGLYSIY